jgi:exopolyphosphatase/guanosine-5'-triphosphate,3'-diphosphate pyrophosphatase
MRCACIDIGSNTTRLLVADVGSNGLREVAARRAFTRISADTRATGSVSDGKLAEVVGVVAEYRAVAAQLGATAVRVVGTAAIRDAGNSDAVRAALRAHAGVDIDVLDGDEEARLAFLGATRTFDRPLVGTVAVVDVGGGSTEIAVGTLQSGVRWSRSLPIGSGVLSYAHQRADPAAPDELAAMRTAASAGFDGLAVPPVDCALAVGGSATSLRRLLGSVLDRRCIDDALALLSARPADHVSAELGLAVERVRLLPAGILVLEAASGRLGCPLELACGGVREGVCLDAAETSPD